MSIFPAIGENEALEVRVEKADIKGYKELKFDFEKKRLVIEDGRMVYADKVTRIQQWIELLIRTQVDKYKVYEGTGYGLHYLYKAMGTAFFNSTFFLSEMERELKEKTEKHEDIEAVKNIRLDVDFNILSIKLTVITEGEEIESEVRVDV